MGAFPPAERLLELVRRERELIEGGRWDELGPLNEERGRVLAALSDPLPAGARAPLVEAERLLAGNTALLAAAIEPVRAELVQLRRGRQMVAGYGGGTQGSSIDASA